MLRFVRTVGVLLLVYFLVSFYPAISKMQLLSQEKAISFTIPSWSMGDGTKCSQANVIRYPVEKTGLPIFTLARPKLLKADGEGVFHFHVGKGYYVTRILCGDGQSFDIHDFHRFVILPWGRELKLIWVS